uniref:G protein-regulated inducer of neurite outgrowth C-terminal domain-containing protein n=1 Tax=Mola mola TaxID=94237 RepID=A0A3Q3VW53_MOLML
MGTNPKRTVTVQMVPQLAVVDTLGNKEPNANWTKEPHLRLSQVCPNPTLTSPDHKQDNISLTASPADTVPHSQNTASRGGEPVSTAVLDKPVPTNGNKMKPEHVTGVGQQMPDLSLTGRGVAEVGGGPRDSNANMEMLSLADEKEICKAGASSALWPSKVDKRASDCRVGPNAAEEECARMTSSAKTTAREDSNKHVSPKARDLNNPCELRHTASGPQPDDKGSNSAAKNKDTAVPQRLQEMDHMHSCSKSSPGVQETPKQSNETTAALLISSPAPSKSKDSEAAFTNKNLSSKHPEKDLPQIKKPQIASDKHQPASSQMDSSTPPQAKPNMATHWQVAEEVSQTSTAVFEGQEQRCKLYKEASTMTLTPSSTPVKQHHDMEVQAVAKTCSRAVATSPSLLPFAVTRRPTGGVATKEEAQSMAIVYQVDVGVGQHPMYLSTLPTSADTRSERIHIETEMFANQSFHSERDKGPAAKPKDLATTLCNTQPVYQINIEHSNHKERGESASSQYIAGVQTSAVKTAPAEAFESAPAQERAAATKSGSADSNNAALSQAAATTRPDQAPSATTTTTRTTKTTTTTKSGLTKNKAGSPQQKAGGKSLRKEGKSGKPNKERERQGEEEERMTWEVYGASVDPESLGFAIQSHLQCKIKEQERKLIVRTSLRKSVSGVDSPQQGRKSKRRHQNIFRAMLQNVRRPNCCVRPPPSAVLE